MPASEQTPEAALKLEGAALAEAFCRELLGSDSTWWVNNPPIPMDLAWRGVALMEASGWRVERSFPGPRFEAWRFLGAAIEQYCATATDGGDPTALCRVLLAARRAEAADA